MTPEESKPASRSKTGPYVVGTPEGFTIVVPDQYSGNVLRYEANLVEGMLKDELVKLGWTPPEPLQTLSAASHRRLVAKLEEMMAMYEEKRSDVYENLAGLISLAKGEDDVCQLNAEHRFITAPIPAGVDTVQYDTLTTQFSFELASWGRRANPDFTDEGWIMPGKETYTD